MEALNPWVELTPTPTGWSGSFACQVSILPLEMRQKLRWGFNAAALLSEALDRQKLFIESQFHGDPLREPASGERALALRCHQVPGEGLLLALVGKVQAATESQTYQKALEYCREVTSTFPYDYKLSPASTREMFERLTGQALFLACESVQSIARLLRFESQIRTQKNLAYVTGFWQSTERADEQIWRAMAGYPHPALLNITLQPGILEADERQLLWDMKSVAAAPVQEISNLHPIQPFEKWVEAFIERRLNPWKRYYLLQVHLLCPAGVTHALARPIGAALTRETADLLSPGFLIVYPANSTNRQEWKTRIRQLELTSTPFHPAHLASLSNLADLNETCAVFRLPYPHEPGLPGVTFLEPLEK
ncbi:MAG: hypothetical protein DDG60_16085 [Anaerolineae bacterium]|nr:MAG: hypothetical protein DDG60_16085 [Anaerolineae bacterium]